MQLSILRLRHQCDTENVQEIARFSATCIFFDNSRMLLYCYFYSFLEKKNTKNYTRYFETKNLIHIKIFKKWKCITSIIFIQILYNKLDRNLHCCQASNLWN